MGAVQKVCRRQILPFKLEELPPRSQSLSPQPRVGSCMTNTTCFSDLTSPLDEYEDVTGSSSTGYVQLHKRQMVPSYLPSDQERGHEPGNRTL